MRTIRSALAVLATAAVMACQTAATSGQSLSPAPVSARSTASVQSAAANQPVSQRTAKSEATANAADSKRSRTIWIVVGVLAAIAIVAVLVAGGGSDSVY